MDELRIALGVLTTPFEVDESEHALFMQQCAADEALALKGLAAYREQEAAQSSIRTEDAERYGHIVASYAQRVIEALDERDAKSGGLDDESVIHVDFSRHTHFDETA